MRNSTQIFAHSLAVIALGALAAGCSGKKSPDSSSSTSVPITSGGSPTSQLVLVSGGNQTVEVGQQLPQAVRVMAQDAQGNPLTGVQVLFQNTVDALGQGSLDGTISRPAVTTGDDGMAETFLTTSTVAGGNHLRVMAPELPEAGQLLVTNFGVPAPATALTLESGDAQQAVAGQNLAAPLTVTVTDQFGNAVPDTQVTFAVATGDAIVLTTSTVTDAGGLAQTLVTAGQTAGDSTITATVAGIPAPLTFTVTSNPDVAAQLVIVSGDAQSGVAGSALPAPCVVGVRDQFGNPIADSTVTFAASTGGGALAAATVTTGIDGNAGSILTLGTTAGTNTVTATVAGVTPVTFTVTGTAGAAATLAIVSGDNQTAIAGAPLGAPLVVSAVDANANPVANFMVQFTVTMGNGQLAAAAVPTDAQGVAQVAYTAGIVAGANQVQATGTGINTPILFNSLGTAGPAAVMQIASGNNQTGVSGTPLAQPFVVLVTDVNGNAVQNVQVAFAVAAGGGTLSAATVATSAQGTAASTLTLGAMAGTNTVTATSGNLTQTFSAMAGAGQATQLASTAGDNQTAVAGTPLQPFVVTVRDANNNPVMGFSVQFAVTAGGGTLSAATVATGADGTATTVLTLGATAGPNTVTANATGLTGSPITFSATGQVGPAATLTLVSGNAQSGTVNMLLPQALTVRVTDAGGNAVQGTTVLWSVAAGAGQLSAASTVSDAQGLASVRYTLGAVAGTNTVQASSGNLGGSPVTFSSSATAAVATTLALVSGDAQTGTAGAPLANMIALRVTDAQNNPVAMFTVGFTVASGNGQVSAASVQTNAMGLALVSWTLGTAAGPNSLTVNATGLAGSPMTLTATGVAGPATQVQIASGNQQSGLVGTALAQPFVVTSTDANGNAVANVPVTFAVATGGGSLSATSVTTNAQGQASTTLTLGAAAGANTVTASSTGLTGVTFTAMGTALPATTLTMVSGNNQNGAVGTALAQPFVVRVTNANNQPVQGFSVGFAVATGGGSLSAATVTTDAQGNAATTLTLGAVPGANTVTVTATGLAGSPMTFSAMGQVGAAATLAVSAGNNQSGIAGSALTNPFVVLATDANNNPVPGASVTFAVTAGGGSLSATTVSANAQGLASTTLTLGAAAATNTVTATVTGVTPVTFTATGMAAPPAAVTIVSGNNQSAKINGALANALVVRVVDTNNTPLAGQSVAFSVVSGGGVLSAASAMTNAQGQASVSYTVGANLGANTVRATVTGITPVDFTAMATALTYAADLAPVLTAKCLICHAPGGVAAAFPLTTYAQVRNGTSLLNVPYVVPFDPTNSSLVQKTQAGGTMAVYAGTDAQLILDWVRTGAVDGSVVLPPSALAIAAGNNQNALVATALVNPLVVLVTDANNAPVSNVTVNWAVATGGGTLSAATSTTDLLGRALVGYTVGATAGANTVTATVTGITPVTFTATAQSAYSGAPLAGSTNPLDIAALVALQANNIEPSALSDDGEFLRRVTGDLTGRLPTAAELTAFEASNSATKRAQVIDTLLASQEFVDHWGEILAVWVQTNPTETETVNNVDVTYQFDTSLRADLANGVTIAELLRKMIESTGDLGNAFRDRHNGSNNSSAADVLGTAFLGMSVHCGRCHDHKLTTPNDNPRWTQAQVYGLYAFLSTSSRYGNPVWVADGTGNQVTGPAYSGTNLAQRRTALANVFTTSPAFFRGTAHRIWSEIATPLLNQNEFLAANLMAVQAPALLDALRDTFANQNTSLQGFLRVAMNSNLYQLSSARADTQADGFQGRYVLRRNAGLVLERGVHQVADVNYNSDGIFRANFGFPSRSDINSRNDAPASDQALMLMNSSRGRAINDGGNQIASLANDVNNNVVTYQQAVTVIVRAALSRDPSAAEMTTIMNERDAGNTRASLEDVAIGVSTSAEFVFRR